MKKIISLSFLFGALIAIGSSELVPTLKSGDTLSQAPGSGQAVTVSAERPSGYAEAVQPVTTTPMQRIPARVEYPDAPVLYGFVSASPYSGKEIPFGSYVSFHAADGIHFENEGFVVPESYTDAFYHKGKFYVINAPVGTNPTISVYDGATGELQSGPTQFFDGVSGTMYFYFYHAVHPTENSIYLVLEGEFDWSTFITARDVYCLDLDTYTITKKGSVTGRFIRTIFFGPDNKLYGVEYTTSKIWEIALDGGENIDKGTLAGLPAYLQAQPGSALTDPTNGRTYLSMQGTNAKSYLMSIDVTVPGFDVQTLSSYPSCEWIQGLYLPDVIAAAPAAVSGFNYADGKLTFTAPTTTYSSKEQLSGSLTANISIDGQTETMAVTPGQSVSLDRPLATGTHYFAVAVSNNAGMGAERKFNIFVGNDLPCAVENLKLDIQGNQALLSWDAPTRSMNHGFVNDADIRYRIVRHPDLTVLASSLAETSFTDNIPDVKEHYYYSVTAMNIDRDGETTRTETFVHGTYYEVPFVEPFSYTADFDNFTVIDNNNDGKTWSYDAEGQCARLEGNGYDDPATGATSTRNNDYLVSLPIDLSSGVHYLLEIEHSEPVYAEAFTVLLGDKAELTGRESTIAERYEVTAAGIDSIVFSPKKSGKQHLFIYNNTLGNSTGININEISITIDGVDKAPAAVAGLKATAGPKAAIANTITFTTPTTAYDGSALSAITAISIFKGADLKHAVHTFTNPAPGTELTWSDPDAQYGTQKYTVVSYNENGQGGNTHVSNWVGLDIPQMPANFKAKMNLDTYQPEFTWDPSPATGCHGGYVDPDAVLYRLRTKDVYYIIEWDMWPPIISDITGTSVIDVTYENEGAQEEKAYMLQAYNDAGYSDMPYLEIVVGKPYDWPFRETFGDGDGATDFSPWILHTASVLDPHAWGIEKTAEGGLLKFTYKDKSSVGQTYHSPRISIDGASTPQLSFYMKHGKDLDPGEVVLHVLASVDDGEWVEIGTVDYASNTSGWLRHSMAITTTGKSMQFALRGEAADASAPIQLDNFAVDNVLTTDLAIESFEIDKRIIRGESGEAVVKISSYGEEKSPEYTVNIYRGDELVASKKGDVIVQNEIKFYLFDIPTTMFDGGKTFAYRAEIECQADQNMGNNASENIVVSVSGSVNPTVDLRGSATETSVTLAWDAPADQIEKTFTDGFDTYESFLINGIGNYIVYDGDGETPIYITSNPLCPNAFAKQAWMVWNPTGAGLSIERYPQLTPRSGNQFLVNWASTDGRAYTRANDDWLFSPEVLPNSDVKFYVFIPQVDGTEEYQDLEIRYTDVPLSAETFSDVFDSDAFTVLDHIRIKGYSEEWLECEYTLPANARQFAIRGCGEGSLSRVVIFLDDLSYVPLGGEKTTLTLQGFDIYRDSQKIASVDASARNYVDTDVEANKQYTYNVVTLWKEGESLLSAPYVALTQNGVENVDAASVKVIGGCNELTIIADGSADATIYTVDGRVAATAQVEGRATVRLSAGVYVAAVKGRMFKVIVK